MTWAWGNGDLGVGEWQTEAIPEGAASSTWSWEVEGERGMRPAPPGDNVACRTGGACRKGPGATALSSRALSLSSPLRDPVSQSSHTEPTATATLSRCTRVLTPRVCACMCALRACSLEERRVFTHPD